MLSTSEAARIRLAAQWNEPSRSVRAEGPPLWAIECVAGVRVVVDIVPDFEGQVFTCSSTVSTNQPL